MSRIFISYRRTDTAGHAQNLHDRLCRWFDPQRELFFDASNIESGTVFPQVIRLALDEACVVLVLIGPGWLEELNRRSALQEVDFVRQEIAVALARQRNGQALVIPVLLGDATMFGADALDARLRDELAGLCALDVHAFHWHGKQADWDAKFVQLRQRIASRADAPRERYRALAGQPQPWHLPPQPLSPHFHDPNELLAPLHHQLQAGQATALVGGRAGAALHGMGGIGKTQLALAYSHRFREVYAGVWWLRAETLDGLQQDAQAACAAVGLQLQPGDDAALKFKGWLEAQRHAPGWLLVWDNAENPALLTRYLPSAGPHAVLITSRSGNWRKWAAPLELEAWQPAQGADFLQHRLGLSDERTEAEALSADLGGLPLALDMAAAYIEQHGLSVADYRQRWQRARQRLLSYAPEDGSYPHSVAAALSLAWDKLSPAARQLLALLAQAAPEPVAERWLRQGAEFMPPELAQAVADDLDWDEVMAELLRHALAKRADLPSLLRPWWADEVVTDKTPKEKVVSLHRLTQQVVALQPMSEADMGECWSQILDEVCPGDAQNPKHWHELGALLPHAVAQVDTGALAAAWPEDRCQRETWVMDRCASALEAQGTYTLAKLHFKRNLELRQQRLGEEHPDTLTSMNNLANTLKAQGDHAGARRLEESVLEVSRRVLGEEHPDTLSSMGNLALTLWNQGDHAGARRLFESVLEVSQRVLGEEHPDTLTSMNNLASTLWNQGDHAGARRLFESVLEVSRRVLGEEHPDTLSSMNNLASTLEAQGDHAGARRLFESVLEVSRRVLGEDHPATLTSMNNLAHTLWAQEEQPAAIALLKQAAAGFATALGPEHPNTKTVQRTLNSWQSQIRPNELPH